MEGDLEEKNASFLYKISPKPLFAKEGKKKPRTLTL
jgi:hypothetical protein